MSAVLSGIIGGSPVFSGNLLSVYMGTSQLINAGNGTSNIIYSNLITASSASSCDLSTGIFTLNYTGKYLVNLKIQLSTNGSGYVFSPPLSIFLGLNGLSNPIGGRQFFYFFGSNSNSAQGTLNWCHIIQTSTAAQTFNFQLSQDNIFGSETYPAVAPGSRSTILYLGM